MGELLSGWRALTHLKYPIFFKVPTISSVSFLSDSFTLDMPCNRFPAVDGEFGLIYGTSASAPVFGSIITLINDARLAIGKRPVGFINPIVGFPVAFPECHAQFTN